MIKGKKLNLRAIERTDMQKMTKWANDPDLRNFVGPQFPVSMYEEEAWFDRLTRNEFRKALIIETKQQEAIGYVYIDLDWVNRKAQLSMAIGEKDYWDKGYGTEVVQIALNHCFNEVNMNKVYLYVFEFNKSAVRLYEKCGFKKEGLIRQDYLIHGKYEDRIIMGILKKEFSAKISE